MAEINATVGNSAMNVEVSPAVKIQDATEEVKGIAQIATTSEAIAGINDSKIITPAKLHTVVSSVSDAVDAEIQRAQQAESELNDNITARLALKVDKVEGKSLIADSEIQRLAGVTNYDDTELKADLAELSSAMENKAEKSEIPTIPQNVSAFNNDAGYLTEHQDISHLATKTELTSGLATKQEKGDYALSSAIPTKTSDLENDSGFLSAVPDEYITEDELTDKGYITDLPVASKTSAGIVKVGDNLNVAADGTISSSFVLPENVTTQGNSFNGANQLVLLDSVGKLPALDGSQLTNLPNSGGSAPANMVTTDTEQTITAPKTMGANLKLAAGKAIISDDNLGNRNIISTNGIVSQIGNTTDQTVINGSSVMLNRWDNATGTEKEFELIDSGNIDDYISGGADLSQIETDIAQIKTDITDIDSVIGDIATVLDLITGEGSFYDELSDKVDGINGEVI